MATPKTKTPASNATASASKLARMRALLPIAAAVMVAVAIGFHTLRGGPKNIASLADADIPVPPGMTKEEAKQKAGELLARTQKMAKNIAAGKRPDSGLSSSESGPATTATTGAAPSATLEGSKPTPAAGAQPPAEAGKPHADPTSPAPTTLASAPPKPRACGTPRPCPSKSAPAQTGAAPALAPVAIPIDPIARDYQAARTELADGYASNAILKLWDVLRAKPDHFPAQELLARLLVDRGEKDAAIEMLHASIRQRPSQPKTRALLTPLESPPAAVRRAEDAALRETGAVDRSAEGALVRWTQ